MIDRDGDLAGSENKAASQRKLVVVETGIDSYTGRWQDDDAAASLHWAELVSGHIFHARASRFREEGKAHQTLLDNLREVPTRLRGLGLPDRYTHDLLARIIFVQFLFDRKDSLGHAAVNADWLERLYRRRTF